MKYFTLILASILALNASAADYKQLLEKSRAGDPIALNELGE